MNRSGSLFILLVAWLWHWACAVAEAQHSLAPQRSWCAPESLDRHADREPDSRASLDALDGAVDSWTSPLELSLPAEPVLAEPASRPSRKRRGPGNMLQATVLPGSGDQLGIVEIESRIRRPLASFPLLSFSPQFTFTLLNGPESSDLPGQLFRFGVDTSLFLPINEDWSMIAGVTPGVSSDFQAYNSEAIRIPGRLLANWRYSDELTISGGVVYLDRDDLGLLPAVGLTWSPQPDLELELNFPRPRVSWQYLQTPERTGFLYLAGELGGGTWSVRRAAGQQDLANLRDLRLLLGWRVCRTNRYEWSVEGGYAFSRSLEYASGVGDLDLHDTGVLRCSIGY